MDCLYRRVDGWIFNPCLTQELTERERAHLSSGEWGRLTVSESMVAHVMANHCIVQDGNLYLRPESEWLENQGVANDNA